MTVRNKVLLSYLLMLLIPAVLILGAGRMLRTYFQGSRPGPDRPRPPLVALALALNTSTRGINLQILEDADGFLDPSVVEGLAPPIRDLGLIVRRADQIVMTSSALEDADDLPDLPPFGIVTRWEMAAELPREPFVVGQWDFLFSDGAEGSLFLVSRPRPPRRPLFLDFGDLIILISILAMVIANGLATFLIYRNVVRPLARLEAAAGRISGGDLETPLIHVRSRTDEIARLNRAFEEMRVRLGDSLARQREYEDNRRELIAGISHDLRTPVTAIKGYVDGIRDGVANTPEKTERYLKTIADKATVVDRLIEELFLLSTLDLNEVPFDFRTIDLGAFLADSVEELRLRYEPEGFSVRLESPEGLAIPVEADAARLRRVLENLVDNAVRHNDREKPGVVLQIERQEERCRLTVSDNGPGIPRDALPHIFDRFYRADQSRSTTGSGLGLAIAKSLVDAHAGSITADCPPTGGTRIVITLPLSKEGTE